MSEGGLEIKYLITMKLALGFCSCGKFFWQTTEFMFQFLLLQYLQFLSAWIEVMLGLYYFYSRTKYYNYTRGKIDDEVVDVENDWGTWMGVEPFV